MRVYLLTMSVALALCVAPAAAGNLNVPSLGGDVSNGGMNGTTLTIQPGAVTAAKMAPGAAAGNLGYTPLAPAANLSDIGSPATARTNLGLGTAATQPSTAFDAAGAATAAQAASLQKSSNLSDVANPATARGNLGAAAEGLPRLGVND